MKYTKYLYGALFITAFAVTSCVDDEPLVFDVQKPSSVANSEYLNDYEALKAYKTNPDLKLGIGVTASEYASEGMIYRLVNENFDEMTAGNAMKYSSVVDDKGAMNFGTVTSFVNAAKNAGKEPWNVSFTNSSHCNA